MVSNSSANTKWAASAALAALSLLMTGCGIQDIAPETAADTPVALAGIARGGQQPIVGATVTLYATQASGYGGTALQLGSPVTTGAGGAFSFNSQTITCPGGQQAYITSSGGNPGAGTNSNVLLMAALGPCANLTQSTFVNIDEVTTVAAAYALSGFTKISGTTVNVTTSSTNNNGSSGVGVAGNYAGLAHAFANAANLANTSTGTANATTVASGSVGTVPLQEINFIADMLATCVNSTGGTEGDSSTCGNLFAATPAINGSFPTNTLQSVHNLALQPYISNANNTTLYGLVTGTPPFATTYSSANGSNDWTLNIGYNYDSNNSSTLPFILTLDANDDVWALLPPSVTTPIVELSSNGVLETLPTGSCGSNCADHITGQLQGAAFDASGNLWLAAYTTSSPPTGLYKYVPSTGIYTFYSASGISAGPSGSGDTLGVPWALAVDKAGDVFFGAYGLGGTPPACSSSDYCQIAELPAGSSTYTTSFGSNALVPTLDSNSGRSQGIAVDNTTNATGGNVIVAETIATNILGIFNAATPSTTASLNEVSVTGIIAPTGVAIDSSSNIWGVSQRHGSASTLFELNSAGTLQPSFPLSGAAIGNPMYLAIDGVGNVFISDYGSDGIVEYNLTKAAIVSPLEPNYPTNAFGGGYDADDVNGIGDSPRGIGVDSTGAVWSTCSNSGDGPPYEIIQTLGVAAPTVAVQALGKYNTLP